MADTHQPGHHKSLKLSQFSQEHRNPQQGDSPKWGQTRAKQAAGNPGGSKEAIPFPEDIGVYIRDNGKENGNYYSRLGLYRD